MLTQADQDRLRDIVYQEIYKSPGEIQQTDMSGFPPLTILTTYHKGDLTACFINPNPTPSNPHLFFIGPYDVLIWQDNMPESHDFTGATALPEQYKEKALQITTAGNGLIGVTSEGEWKKTVERLVSHEAGKYIDTYARRLAILKGWPIGYARMALLSETNGAYARGIGSYIKSLDEAYQSLKQ